MPKKKGNKNSDNKKSKRKSSNKNKKEKDNKKDISENIVIPKRPRIIREKKKLIHDNPSQANEAIVKSILDKIINLSVRNSFLNSVNKQIQDYYFDYMKNQVNTLFATTHIFYYDEPEIEQCNRKEIFWNKKYEKSNTWIEISEPNTSKCDRYENAFMNYINFTYNSSSVVPSVSGPITNKGSNEKGTPMKNNDLNDIKIRSIKKYTYNVPGIKKKDGINQQILDVLEEKSSISSCDEESKDLKKTKNNINKSRNDFNLKSISTFKKTFPKNNNNQNMYSKTNSNNNNINNNPNRRPKKEPVLEMNHKEIPGIDKEYNYEKYDPPNIISLRKERQIEIIKKEIEERKNALHKKIMSITKNEKKDNLVDTKIKMFDSNKFSFDSNGKIISFKPIKMDTFTKDFVSLKNGVKTFDNPKMKKIIKKNKINPQNNPQNKTDDTLSSNQNNTNLPKEKVIKNPEDDPNGINKHNYVKKNIEKNENIIPSGSNFSIMLPNIGVVLKEDEQIKEGNRDFGKYFKKYSIKDYDKILRDYVPLQNRTMLKNKMNQSMGNINMNVTTTKKLPKKFMSNTNNSFKINSKTTGNNLLLSTQTQNYSNINNADVSNPLINQADTIQENDSIAYNNNTYNINNEFNLNNINSINNSSLFRTIKSYKNQSYNNSSLYSPPMSLMRNGSYDNLVGIIKLNTNSSSLKNELDSLKDLDDKDNLNYYPTNTKIENTGNIFTKNYRDLLRNKNKNNISNNNLNEFNKKIISTKGWGNKTMSKNMSTGNLLISKHLTRYQALRELGSNLLNGIKVKLPRDRKVDVKI